MKAVLTVCLVAILIMPVYAQFDFGVICSTDSRLATGPNNSHKLAHRYETVVPFRDTATVVFQSSESIYLSLSGNGVSRPWSRPVALYPGANPGIAYGRNGNRHLVWEMFDTILGARNIFYRNLEYRMVPIDVSGCTTACYHPDVSGDSSGVAHIVWAEDSGSTRQIFYRRADQNGVIGERVRISSARFCDLPAIEQFSDQICVIWEQFDTTQAQAYKIVRRRYTGGIWLPEEVLLAGNELLGSPSLDFSLGNEGFSAAWVKAVAGNLEVHFEGGNLGGGYPTFGASTGPVLATIGTVWSYYFWQEDSAGFQDIYSHFYYFMSGWSPPGSVRRFFSIDEPVSAPNCLGALLVWTQGATPPYKVMWGFFDYPIGVEERTGLELRRLPVRAAIVRGVFYLPAAGGERTALGCSLFDVTGRKVMELQPGANDVRHLPHGIYCVRFKRSGQKVIIQD
ncbi:MAG: hypothetical protein ACUVUR_04730 [bacterium]